MAEHFYPLRVAEIVPETEEANSIRFEVPEELEDVFRFKAGQHLTLRAEHRRRGGAAQLFTLRRARRGPAEGHRQADRRRRLFQLGRRQSEGRRHARRDDAARLVHGRVRSGSQAALCRLRRRLGHHAGHLADQDRARHRARQPLHPLLRQPRRQLDHLPGAAGGAQGPLPRPVRALSFPQRRGGRRRPVQRHARPRDLRRGDRASGR